MNLYYCPKCKTIAQRDSKSKTIKSTCSETGKKSILVKVDDTYLLSVKFRKYFLKNAIDLNSFTKKERLFLNMAFEQGAQVVLNSLKLIQP